MWAEWHAWRITLSNDAIGEQWLLIRRNPQDPTDYQCYVSNAPIETPLVELAGIALTRHSIEQVLEEAKGQTGLADYEVRHWHGWHRHITLALLAHTFLKLIQHQQREKKAFAQTEGDTVQIASDKTEYEIIIIEPGFNFWLQSIARPEDYYSQSYLENRNQIYVTTWNQRVLLPSQFDPSLYEMQSDYSPNIDYGYEVNYKLYNYFIYFQRRYNQRLGPWLPRI